MFINQKSLGFGLQAPLKPPGQREACVCVSVRSCMREGERHTDTDRDTETIGARERQGGRETEREEATYPLG